MSQAAGPAGFEGPGGSVETHPDMDEASGPEEGNRLPAARSRAVLDYLARQIVDEPDDVVVEAHETRGAIRLDLHVAPGDMGKVIGRKGRTAQAIRTVVRATASLEGANVVVDIVD